MVMVYNDIFNKIPVKSWRSVVLVQETGVPGEHWRPATSHWQCCNQYIWPKARLVLTTLVVIGAGTDCIFSCKSNYHTTTTTPYMYKLPNGSAI